MEGERDVDEKERGTAMSRGRPFNVGCLVSLPVMVAIFLLAMCSRMLG